MNQESVQSGKPMPKLVEFILTKQIPCAITVVLLLTSVYWLNLIFGNSLLGALFMLLGTLLHLSVPAIFSLVLMGGGLTYALQVGGIAALGVLFISEGSFAATLVFAALYVVIPLMTAVLVQYRGLGKSSWLLAVSLFVVVLAGMMVGMEGEGMKAFIHELFKPMFDNMIANVPAGEVAAIESVQRLQEVLVQIFPGMMVLSLWLVWWSDVLLARKYAEEYGFYQGDRSDMLSFSLPSQLVFVLLLLAAVANLTEGDLQYLALNILLVLSGLISVQGTMVAHAWLKSRGMMNTIVVMYVMLFFWSVVILVFMLVGLLDIWFNFRRNTVSATGEK